MVGASSFEDLGDLGRDIVEKQVQKRVGDRRHPDQVASWDHSKMARLSGRRRSSMKVKADFDLCESNALCEALAPDVFELDDDDYLQISRPTR